MTTTPNSTRGPLTGFRVLELCTTIAGPACARLLGDFGADVIKVEPPEGDALRKLGVPDQGVSLYATSILRNKRAVTIDLKTPEGVELVLKIAEECDIVVENFRPGVLERLGLGFDELTKRNPAMVLVRISGYGQTGPNREKAGYGAICEAFGGIRELIGEPDRPPPRVAVPVTDYLSAAYAAMGATMALLEAGKTGRGQVVDVALYETAFSMMEASIPGFERFRHSPTREGSRLPFMAPNNLYKASDGTYVLLAANSDATFKRLGEAMGAKDWLVRYPTIPSRWEKVDALDAEIGAWVASRSAADAEKTLDAHGVPVSRVYKLSDIYGDPHYAARDMLLKVPQEKLGHVTQLGIVPKLSATPGSVRWAGPEQSADTRAVLRDFGIDDAQLDELERRGVIRQRKEP